MIRRKGNPRSRGKSPRREIRIPTQTFDNSVLTDSKRPYPSIQCLTKLEQEELERRVRGLIDFETQARVPYQVADFISNRLQGKPGFEQRNVLGVNGTTTKKKYFFRDPWSSESMIIVKEGELPITEGFNLILCHSDSPCLKIKAKPIQLEWDPDEQYHHLGVRLSCIEHGGLLIHQWPAQQVRVIGYVIDNSNSKVYLDVPGFVPDFSAHVDLDDNSTRRDRFQKERTLEVVLGHTSVKETLQRFGMESMDDFAKAKLFGVPNNEPMPIDEYTWRLLASYGHDDRSCVYSAVDALIKSRNPKLTAIVWITDNEEVGDVPPSGANGNFFNLALDYLCQKHERNGSREHEGNGNREISERDKRRICMKSSLLYGDVNIAPCGHDAKLMDIKNAPKLGFGVAISGEKGSCSSETFVKTLIDLAKRGQSQGLNICPQVVGDTYHQDETDRWYLPTSAQEIVKLMGQWGHVGIPCAALHSPNEIICPGDEFATYRFYKRFFESNTGMRDNNK